MPRPAARQTHAPLASQKPEALQWDRATNSLASRDCPPYAEAKANHMSRKLVLQNFLPYLLNRAGLRIGVLFSHDIEPYGVTLPMWRVLIELCYKGNHRLGELSERTSIDQSTLSRLLVTMQRKGLIVRRRSGLDGRALSLSLTERGLELTEKIAPYAVRYERIAMRGLNQRDIGKLRELLKAIFSNLETAERAETAQRRSERKRPRKTNVGAAAKAKKPKKRQLTS
jgi:DNA-binding MarR family transcriptional regulator